jgi:ATP-binding cassette subfamily B protein
MLFFLVKIKWEIGLIVFMTFGIALAVTGSLIRNNIRTRREFNQVEDEISDIIVDNLINFETVKLFAREKWERRRLQKKFVNWFRRLWDYSMSFRMIDIIIGGLGNIGLVVALIYGLKLVTQDEIGTGSFVMVVGFVSSFYNRFFELVYNLRQVAKHTVDIQKYFAILNETPEVADPKKPKTIREVAGEIKFDKIWFAYPKNKNKAVEEINLDIRGGQSVAFVGHSGVGKTTLVKLLLRFYDPDSGKITIDGIDIKEMRKSDLRAMVGVVPQEPIMFNNTIGYNITYGRSSASKKEMIAAAKMANLYDFIMTLPQKFETNVGERGVKLSGGQKQRLAIARMILKNPEIIIFDEATSQLDSESEKLIQEAFWKAAENKTTIVIAHRLSTVVRAEKIVVMEKGRIKEVGSHRQLLADKESLYSRFWALQTG